MVTSEAKSGGRFGMMLFLIIGLGALVIAAWQGWQTLSFQRSAVLATAIVVQDAPGMTAPISAGHPMLEFTPAGGTPVRFRQNGMGPTPIGEHLDLLYLPSDPKGTASATSFWTLWGGTLLPLVMGLGCIGLALSGAVLGVRPGRY